jgi:type I restriction enzyme M protein
MQWIAPSAKDSDTETLEKRLWDAADQLRANSGLSSQQYSGPVLGLIFLRFAEVRFAKRRAELQKQAAGGRRGSRVDDPSAYHAEGVLFLAPNARFDFLLALPEGENIGSKVNDAMRRIERDNPQVAGVLPKTYELFSSTLMKQLLKRVSEISARLDYDAFGRIYEYFLGEFARKEGQRGGEFFTPASIVRFLVEVIEPYHGAVFDPATGSGGMFVQSARFVSEHKKDPSRELSIHGQEKVGMNVALARMNLAIHGLEGDIREVNSYYDDPFDSNGRFDFVLANPPFNVNAVDKERLEAEVGKGRRFPFGLPTVDNANYLWIQLFYSALDEKGRAGFVMANSASDARGSESEIRKHLINSRAVDAMVAVGPNMFYTVTLPCTLWFLDKGSSDADRSEKVLFLDARRIYRQVDRAHRDWTPAQIGFIANVVRLYRGEEPDFTLGGGEAEAKVKEIFGKKPKYVDVAGLCRAATLKEIEAQGWSLNPGPLRRRGRRRSRERRGLQGTTRNAERGTRNLERPGPRPRTNHHRQRGGDTGAMKKPFREFVTLQRGFDLPRTEMRDGPFPVVGSTSIIGYHDKFKVNPPGVVTGRSGSLGTVQFLRERYWPHNTSLWVKDFKENDPRFVYYQLQDLDFARFNAGAGVPTLNRNHLDTLEVDVPPLPVQRRIAGTLSAYDELIENSQRRIRILEAIARALYREWFAHFRFPGHEKVPLVGSPLGEIPPRLGGKEARRYPPTQLRQSAQERGPTRWTVPRVRIQRHSRLPRCEPRKRSGHHRWPEG